jgi:hypothetical protein
VGRPARIFGLLYCLTVSVICIYVPWRMVLRVSGSEVSSAAGYSLIWKPPAIRVGQFAGARFSRIDVTAVVLEILAATMACGFGILLTQRTFRRLSRRSKTISATFPQTNLNGQNLRPHWAIALFVEPTVEYRDQFEPGKEYPANANYDRALGSFDETSPGWVPLWFPRNLPEGGRRLSPSERLHWFDKALEWYGREGWPPVGPLISMKRSVALALLHMESVVELGELPTPDKL